MNESPAGFIEKLQILAPKMGLFFRERLDAASGADGCYHYELYSYLSPSRMTVLQIENTESFGIIAGCKKFPVYSGDHFMKEFEMLTISFSLKGECSSKIFEMIDLWHCQGGSEDAIKQYTDYP